MLPNVIIEKHIDEAEKVCVGCFLMNREKPADVKAKTDKYS